MHHDDDICILADVGNIKLKNVLQIFNKEGPLVFKGGGFDGDKQDLELVQVKEFDRNLLVLELLDRVKKCVEVVGYVAAL